MKLFTRRPGTVQAVEFTGTNIDEVDQAFGPDAVRWHRPYVGEFLVRDTDGVVRKFTAAQFNATFEPVL